MVGGWPSDPFEWALFTICATGWIGIIWFVAVEPLLMMWRARRRRG